MTLENPVGGWYVRFVPTVVAGFVPGDEQDSRSAGIERIQYTEGVTCGLGPKLSHFRKAGSLDLSAERKAEIRTVVNQQSDSSIDFRLFAHGQRIPPMFELVSELDCPWPWLNIASKQYGV